MDAYLYGREKLNEMIMPETECKAFMADSTRHVMKDDVTGWAAIVYRHADGRLLVFDVVKDSPTSSLIAAAPKMKDALRKFVAYHDADHESMSPEEIQAMYDAAIDAAKDALPEVV